MNQLEGVAAVEEPFCMRRLGMVMAPNQDDPREVEGVLNPAAVRGPDGELYLFPRMVAKGNYSRIGIARVRFNGEGDPIGVERLGIALEPSEPYERNSITGGGCEDPRVTYCEPLSCYVMTYTAFSPRGPRIALAVSHDLFHWDRLGLARFAPADSLDFNDVDNKDALLFPKLIPDPWGTLSVALIHRPLFSNPLASNGTAAPAWDGVDRRDQTAKGRRQRLHHESLWTSYCSGAVVPQDLDGWRQPHRLMSPRASWERMKVGGGTPPILTKHGWLVLYHGVSGHVDEANKRHVRYSAGALILDADHPEEIRYRSPHAILAPAEQEASGFVPNVVFPTGIDRRDDLGLPQRLDIYYGMADDRIGVATLTIPDTLPESPEHPEARRDALPA